MSAQEANFYTGLIMKRLILSALALSVTLCAEATLAATFQSSATIVNGNCSEFESNETGSSATCATATSGALQGIGAFASSEDGTLRVSTETYAFRNTSGVLEVSGQESKAQAVIQDTLFFDNDEGVFRLEVDLLGALALSASSIGAPSTLYSQISFDVSANGTLYEIDAALSEGVGFGGSSISVDLAEVVDRVEFFEFDYTGGSLDIFMSLQASTLCAAALPSGGSCEASAQFENSLRLIGGEVLDLNGNILDAGFLSSESGFNYIEGVDPHDRGPTPVPLPAGMPLLLIGLATIASLRRCK